MKKEIEAKILNVDLVKLRRVLKKLGARTVSKPKLFTEIYWESPLEKRDYSSFRIREEGKQAYMTLKQKKTDSTQFEIRDEYEMAVGDFSVAKAIIEALGFRAFRTRQKVRESYELRGVRFDIDQYPNIKPYLEIEANTEQKVKSALRKLGFPPEFTAKMTASEIIKNAGLDPNNLMFSRQALRQIRL